MKTKWMYILTHILVEYEMHRVWPNSLMNVIDNICVKQMEHIYIYVQYANY